MKIKLWLWFFIVFLLFVNSVYAVNYVLTYNSVENWEIRWWWSTKYTTQWNSAISMWNNYWKVDILPDTISTYEDLTVSDVTLSNVWWSGQHTYYSWGSDTLKLNTYLLDGKSIAWTFSSAEKQHTIWHELWHAYWLAHHSLVWNVLRSWKWAYTVLWTQDKLDYNDLWWN